MLASNTPRLALVTLLSLVSCVTDNGLSEDSIDGVSFSITKGSPGAANGDGNFCNDPLNPCVAGEGDCDLDSQCVGALICGRDNGENFGFPTGLDVCVPSACTNRVLDVAVGETQIDCGGQCGTVCAPPVCPPPAGNPGDCSTDCVCGEGEGDCDTDAECDPGLVCGQNIGSNFGYGGGSDVCVDPTCVNGVLDAPNETQIDCGGTCGTNCAPIVCPPPTGSPGDCTTDCLCDAGEGDCDEDADCSTGNVCAQNVGADFGFSAGADVCVPTTCFDGMQNAGETGVDCGGGCVACPGGIDAVATFGSANGNERDMHIETSAAGLVVAGSFSENITIGGTSFMPGAGRDSFIAEITTSGAVNWVVSFGGSEDVSVKGVAVDSATGDIYATGSMKGSVNFGLGTESSAGDEDIFLLRLDGTNGNVLAQASFGGASRDVPTAVDFSAGQGILVGGFQGTATLPGGSATSAGNFDGFIVTFNDSLVGTGQVVFGADGFDAPQAVALDGPNNSAYLCGNFESSVDFGGQVRSSQGGIDVFVLRIALPALTTTWLRSYGGPTRDNCLAIDYNTSRVAAAGYFTSSVNFGRGSRDSAGSGDGFVLFSRKSNGTPLTDFTFGGPQEDRARGIAANGNSAIAVAGMFRGTDVPLGDGEVYGAGDSDGVLHVFDGRGALQFLNTIGGSGFDYRRTATYVGNTAYTVGAFSTDLTTPPFTHTGFEDIFVDAVSP